MNKVTIEMSQVSRCEAIGCAYNVNQGCCAKAITIGDAQDPNCDTFFAGDHIKEKKHEAGVGACKVSSCRYNEDFECTANNVALGFVRNEIKCQTYVSQ